MVNVFSFSLFGEPNPLYYDGIIGNIELINKHYPTWLIFVYIGNDVPNEFVEKIRSYPNTIIRYTNETGLVNTMYRFFAIDEAGVDVMFVRDADSRVHWKDRWAINNFLKSSKKCHIIRDHYCHDIAMLAGTWGMRKIEGLNIRELFDIFMKNPTTNNKGIDQEFLRIFVYPKMVGKILVHHSNNFILDKEYVIKFPFDWVNDIYCGRVEDSTFKDSPAPVNYNIPHVSINFRR